MFKFKYANESIKSMLSKSRQRDEILEEELSPVLKDLKEQGETSGASFGMNIFGETFELERATFRLVYSVIPRQKIITFYECKFLSQGQRVEWQRLLLQENFELSLGEEIALPQLGIKRIFSALECIYKGRNNAYELGRGAGSKAKNKRDVARYGQYDAEFLGQAGLIDIKQEGKESAIYCCSEKIAKSFDDGDKSTTYRLIAEALLGFPAIRYTILEATSDNKELTLSLIQNICHSLEITRYSQKTLQRRAQSVRGLINWLARDQGIPIRREGSQHIQPFLNLDVYESQIE